MQMSLVMSMRFIFGSQIEKAHLQFCKRYLEVNNKASNIACRAELGRFPLNITINQKILKYILYIQSKDDESLVKHASVFNVIRLTL